MDLSISSSGYQLLEPLEPDLEIYTWIYAFIGIPLFLNAVISFLNQARGISENIASRENVFKTIMASGDRFHSHNSRNAHIQQHQSFIQENAKNEMIQADYE
jgi:hypothetical protein